MQGQGCVFEIRKFEESFKLIFDTKTRHNSFFYVFRDARVLFNF